MWELVAVRYPGFLSAQGGELDLAVTLLDEGC